MSELKPCPFCGGEAEIKNTRVGRPYFAVVCSNCRASTRIVRSITWKKREELYNHTMGLIKDAAIDAWNRRTT